MRRAEWRRRADDPKGPLGWWWRGVWARRALAYAALPFGVCFLIGYAGAGWGWFLLATANLAFLATRPSRGHDRLASLLPDPAPPGQFRAEVAYRREGQVTGRDEMALCVVDGWLYAEGVRSHFALRRADVRDLRTGSDMRGRMVLEDESEVWLSEIDDPSRVVLERWWVAQVFGEGEATLPPARVHEQELARRASWMFLPCLAFPLMTAARSLSSEWGIYAGALFMILGFFLVLLVGTMRSFLTLVRIDDRAKREYESLSGQVPPLQGAMEERDVRVIR